MHKALVLGYLQELKFLLSTVNNISMSRLRFQVLKVVELVDYGNIANGELQQVGTRSFRL